jgi:hypothetical protein
MSTVYEAKLYAHAHPRAVHETTEARRSYADAARAVGITETIDLLHENRPAAALRRMAQTVEAELAIEGLSGIRINVAAQMAQLIADRHRAEAGAR